MLRSENSRRLNAYGGYFYYLLPQLSPQGTLN